MADYPDFEGDKSGLYLKPEWAAKEGVDKNFLGSTDAPESRGEGVYADYSVPAGETLFVTQLSFLNRSVAAADSDNAQMCEAGLIVDDIRVIITGGNGGGAIILNKPLRVNALSIVRGYAINWANHLTQTLVAYGGYVV